MTVSVPALVRLTNFFSQFWRSDTKRPVLLSLLLAICVLTVVAAALLDSRRDVWERAADASANLARVVERDLSSEIKSVDLALLTVMATLERADAEQISPEFRHAVVLQHVNAARYLDAVLLLDATGEVIFDSRLRTLETPMNLGDRDYFIAHRDQAKFGFFVSRPFRSRLADGQWTIGFSRRRSHQDGSFAGVALGVIRLSRLEAAFAGMQLGPGGSMTLFRSDGIILARMPADERQLGRDLSNAPAVRQARQAAAQQFVAVSGVDGVERFYTQRHLVGIPSFVNVALSVNDIYAAWWRKSAAIGAVIVLLVGGMTLLLWRLHRELTQRRALQDGARASEATFRLIAENSSDIVSRLDARGRRLYISPAAERILGRPAAELLGRSALDDIVPEDLPIMLQAMERLAACEREVRVEYRAFHTNGTVIWLEASARATLDPRTGEPDGVVAVARDVTERKALEGKLAALARTDGLTGLANRRAFDEALEVEWRRTRRDQAPLSLLLLDVDRFKLFNDTYGHLAGDDCLKTVAKAVANSIHRPADLVARYGGEEIVILLPCVSPEGAAAVAERIRTAVEQLGLTHAANSPFGVVTASIGVATAASTTGTDLSAKALIAAADAALYSAKRSGRNQCTTAPSVPPPAVLPPISLDEEARLAVVAHYASAGSTHSGSDELDRIVRLAAALLGTSAAAISLIGSDRQEFIARVGLEAEGTSRDISLCSHLIGSNDEFLVVPNAALDRRFAANPFVLGSFGLRFYAGAALVCPRTGHRLGALCAIDQRPQPALDPAQCAVLADLAALAMYILGRRREEITTPASK